MFTIYKNDKQKMGKSHFNFIKNISYYILMDIYESYICNISMQEIYARYLCNKSMQDIYDIILSCIEKYSEIYIILLQRDSKLGRLRKFNQKVSVVNFLLKLLRYKKIFTLFNHEISSII